MTWLQIAEMLLFIFIISYGLNSEDTKCSLQDYPDHVYRNND